jgi:hypothetical protein
MPRIRIKKFSRPPQQCLLGYKVSSKSAADSLQTEIDRLSFL